MYANFRLIVTTIFLSFVVLYTDAASTTGQVTDTSWLSNAGKATWTVQVTSTKNVAETVTITWHAVKVGLTQDGGGGNTGGTFTLNVPAYPGFGAAKVASGSVSGVGSFTYKATYSAP